MIDIAAARRGVPGARRVAAGLIDLACRKIGFFCVDGQRVDASLIARIVEVSDTFFPQRVELKERFPSVRGNPVRGWSARTMEGLSGPVEVHEHLELSRFDVPEDVAAVGYSREWVDQAEPSVWPSHPGDLEAVWKKYFGVMDRSSDPFPHLGILAITGVAEMGTSELGSVEFSTRTVVKVVVGNSRGFSTRLNQ